MNKFLLQHTNNLIKSAISVANSNNIKHIPYPKNNFKNKKIFELYLNNLTNFIDKPELFYLNKQINKININDNAELNKKYFKFIKY